MLLAPTRAIPAKEQRVATCRPHGRRRIEVAADRVDQDARGVDIEPAKSHHIDDGQARQLGDEPGCLGLEVRIVVCRGDEQHRDRAAGAGDPARASPVLHDAQWTSSSTTTSGRSAEAASRHA